MRHEDKYSQADFTLANYKRLVTMAKDKYRFSDFCEWQDRDYQLIWRHDIDFSVALACEVAAIEQDLGVKATYFLQLSSYYYSLFETTTLQTARKIADMGHHIGLHFDSGLYGAGTDCTAISERINFEKGVLEYLLGIPIRVFSFHNPSDNQLRLNQEQLAGLINVYAFSQNRHLKYCSDSNGYWRFDRLEDILAAPHHRRLHILTHPVWWQKEVMPPRHRIQTAIDSRATGCAEYYDRLLAGAGRENVS